MNKYTVHYKQRGRWTPPYMGLTVTNLESATELETLAKRCCRKPTKVMVKRPGMGATELVAS